MSTQKRWNGATLTVLWVIEFVVSPLHIAATAAVLMTFAHDASYIPPMWIAALTLFSFCFLALPLEITGYFYNFLNPWLYLGLQIFKALFYIIGLVIIIYNFVNPPPIVPIFWNILKYANLALDLILLIAFLVALGYGSVVVHRYRKLGTQYNQLDRVDQEETKRPSRRQQRVAEI